MFSNLVVWPPFYICDPFQLVIFYHLVRAFPPGFCVVFTSDGVFFHVNSNRFHLRHPINGFLQLLLYQPVCQPHHIRLVDAKEDVQDLRLLSPCFHRRSERCSFYVPNDPSITVALTRASSLLTMSFSFFV